MVKVVAGVLVVLIVSVTPALSQLTWCWRFAGSGVSAAGSFITGNVADQAGFHRIIAINGTANAAAVTALQPNDTAIPGNAGFPVDNLIRPTAPQLTKHGFGFAAADGSYHNPFHLEQYLDYVSRPPYADGKGAEPPIQFKASVAAPGAACSRE